MAKVASGDDGAATLGGALTDRRAASRCDARAIGVVGCGAWAETGHLPALRGLAGVEVVACAGRDATEAEVFAGRQGIPHAFDSLESMLAWGGVGAVTIAAPDQVHAPAVLAALAAGVPVFCEKPLADSVETAETLVTAQASSGIPATVGYSFRYSPAIRQLREDLSAGRIGEPWLLELSEYNSQFHPRFGKPMNWKGDPALAGAGALFEYGSHVLDLALWLLGPMRRVSSQLCRVLPGARLDDIATVLLEPARGGAATMTCGWVLAGGFPGIRLRLHGSEGAAEAELSDCFVAGEEYRRLALDGGRAERVELPAAIGRFAYVQRHFADFLDHEQNDAEAGILPGFGEGALVQRLLAAAAAAGATDRWVELAEAPGRASSSTERRGEGLSS